MATPPMIDQRVPPRHRPDPLVAVAALLLVVVVIGLGMGGVLAIYDWRTPAAMWPLVRGLFALGGFVIVLLVTGLAVRWARSGRPK